MEVMSNVVLLPLLSMPNWIFCSSVFVYDFRVHAPSLSPAEGNPV